MHIRRVVTAKSARGGPTVALDGRSPRAVALEHTPGQVSSPIWSTASPPKLAPAGVDAIADVKSLLPGPGETRFMVVTFAPDSVMASPDFDASLAGAEFLRVVPGLAETFETDNPGMHTTPTVDYGVVLDGEIWLELDDGETVHLKEHDTIVQNGVRHAWRNKADRPATVAFVLVGVGAA